MSNPLTGTNGQPPGRGAAEWCFEQKDSSAVVEGQGSRDLVMDSTGELGPEASTLMTSARAGVNLMLFEERVSEGGRGSLSHVKMIKEAVVE